MRFFAFLFNVAAALLLVALWSLTVSSLQKSWILQGIVVALVATSGIGGALAAPFWSRLPPKSLGVRFDDRVYRFNSMVPVVFALVCTAANRSGGMSVFGITANLSFALLLVCQLVMISRRAKQED